MRSWKEWWVGRRWAGVVLAATLLLAGCSGLRFAYNQGPELAYWWLDGYADFDDIQAARVREALTAWFRWHRSTQLDDYAVLLARAQHDVVGDVTPQQLCEWNAGLRRRVELAFDQAAPPLAELMATLSPAQVQHIERRYAKSNAEFRREFLQPEPGERLAASVKRAVDRAETFYGRLDAAQRERLARGVVESPFYAELWLSERQARQQDSLAVLRRLQANPSAESRPAQARAELQRIGGSLYHSPREAYRVYGERLIDYNCALAAELHNSTTPAQRETLAGKLRGWEHDVRLLAGAAGH